VTGAASGIGEATARRLAGLGASVALLARREDRLTALAAQINESGTGGRALQVTADVTDASAVQAAAARVADELGVVDIVVNSAGVCQPSPLRELRTADWHREIDTNVTGMMHVIASFLPRLVDAAAAGGPADLVTVSSTVAHAVVPGGAVYAGTKAFVSHMSASLREELGETGVRVLTLEPGMVATEAQDAVTEPELRARFAALRETAMQPEDIADAVAFAVAQPARVTLQLMRAVPTRQSLA
jgi:NADP-dependent 3-hydroxy acid dehydrogenase YdfG